MTRREQTSWPLVVGAVCSVALHITLLPAGIAWLVHGRAVTEPSRLTSRPQTSIAPKPRVELGANVPLVSTVAWISHDDFRKLIAPKGKTIQPAVQQQIDPQLEVPTPPTVSAQSSPSPELNHDAQTLSQTKPSKVAKSVQPVHTSTASHTSSKQNDVKVQPLPEPAEKTLELTKTGATTAATVAPAPVPAPTSETTAPSPSTTSTTSAVSQDAMRSLDHPAVAATPKPAPVSAAATRSDKDSDPVALSNDPVDVQLGQVVTGRGIEIKPARPDLSVVTLLSAIPNHALAKIVFDAEGKVTRVELLQSTGYQDIDGPLEASLYKWKASGPLLDEVGGPVEIQVRIIGY